MSEPEFPEDKKPDPYDLWPDETPSTEIPQVETIKEEPFEAPFVPVAYTPETTEETVRQGGLAWSAGIVFFGSVAFMLFLGWLADLLLGSSPFGIVAGIIFGSGIGFIQFFRISSKIFPQAKSESGHSTLFPKDDDKE